MCQCAIVETVLSVSMMLIKSSRNLDNAWARLLITFAQGVLEHGKYIMTHSWTPEHLCKCVQGTFCVQCRTTVGHAVAVVAEGASSITIIDGDELACHCGHAFSFKAPSVTYILESDTSVRCASAVMDSDI